MVYRCGRMDLGCITGKYFEISIKVKSVCHPAETKDRMSEDKKVGDESRSKTENKSMDPLYAQALCITLEMDFVTLGILKSKLKGQATQNKIKRLIAQMAMLKPIVEVKKVG